MPDRSVGTSSTKCKKRSKSVSYGRLSRDNQASQNEGQNGRNNLHDSHFRRLSDTNQPVIKIKNDSSVSSRSYVVNLQPGSYKVNVELRSKVNPISIVLIPNEAKNGKDTNIGVGLPPKKVEPLLYERLDNTFSSASLIKKHGDTSESEQQQNGNMRTGEQASSYSKRSGHIHRSSRQRKGKHRWGSLSCFPLSHLDDSFSEQSGGDSFSGYEGVEHLKRSSFDNNNSNPDKQIGKINFVPCHKDFILTNRLKNTVIDKKDNTEKFKLAETYAVSCDAIINSNSEVQKLRNNKIRTTFREDEAFLKQVVDEYFDESVPEQNSDTSFDDYLPFESQVDSANSSGNNYLTKSASDCYLYKSSSLANVTLLNSKLSSSCIMGKNFNSELETINEMNSVGNIRTTDSFQQSSEESSLLQESDEISSCHSSDSQGYEADVEPNEKEVCTSKMFSRSWRSAPNVCNDQNFKLKKHYNASTVVNTDLSNENVNVNIPRLNYIPRRSNSDRDAQFVNSFVGIEKIRAHKLKRFVHETVNENKCSAQSFVEDNPSSFSEHIYNIPTSQEYVYSDSTITSLDNMSFEFVNRKFYERGKEQTVLNKKTETSTDEYSVGQSEEVLEEGIVFNRSYLKPKVDSISEESLLFLSGGSKQSSKEIGTYNNSAISISDRVSSSIKSKKVENNLVSELKLYNEVNLGGNFPIYYNVKKNYESGEGRGIWQQKDMPASCSNTRGSGENMESPPLTGKGGSLWHSDNFKVKQSCGSVGRVQERGDDEHETCHVNQNSGFHVRPNNEVNERELHYKNQSESLPKVTDEIKVSEYTMGNQAGKENNYSDDTSLPIDKPNKKKNYCDKKSRKYFNNFLESLGTSGVLSKNRSIRITDSEDGHVVHKNVTLDNNSSANKVECYDSVHDKQHSLFLSDHKSESAYDIQNSLFECKSNIESKRASIDVQPISSVSENEYDCVKVIDSTENKSFKIVDAPEVLYEKNDEPVSQPIYENALFIDHHYLGKFSYINSLVQSDNSDEDIPNSMNTSSHSNFENCDEGDTFLINKTENYDQNEIKNPEQFDCDHLKNLPHISTQPNQVDEEILSCVSNLNNSDVEQDSESCDSGKFVACPTDSSGSIASDTSSFYYTAGGLTLYDQIESAADFFALNDEQLIDSNNEYRKENTESHERKPSNLVIDISPSNTQSDSKHDNSNFNVILTEDKILVSLQPSDETVDVQLLHEKGEKLLTGINIEERPSSAGKSIDNNCDISNVSDDFLDLSDDGASTLSFDAKINSNRNQITRESDLDSDDLLANYFSGTGEFAPDNLISQKLDDEEKPTIFDENCETEPDCCSIYAHTTLSIPTSEIFSSEEYPSSSLDFIPATDNKASSFTSSKYESHDQDTFTTDSYTSRPSENMFHRPSNDDSFEPRRHSFQFTGSSSPPTKNSNLPQRKSESYLNSYHNVPKVSPASSVDSKKPPMSPSHRNRDTNSVPLKCVSRLKKRRRCRSVSPGSSVSCLVTEEGSVSARSSSLISLSKTTIHSSSQESLYDLPLRFSPARGDKAPNTRWLAERKKNEGNEFYKNKKYRDALKLYTESIELCVDCASYYSNRSACHMMLGKYSQALVDAREAVRLDSTFVKGYIRIAKCNIALGDANAALSILRQAAEFDGNNKSIRDEVTNAEALIKCCAEVEKAASKQEPDYRMAIFHLDRAIVLAAGCRNLKITKAEYLVFLQRYVDAQDIVNEILQFDNTNADAMYVRGMCLYYQNSNDSANAHFQQVLRLAPDHRKAKDAYKKGKLLRQKKEEGNQAFNRGQLQDALRIYSEALAIDVHNQSTNSKLYNNRATVRAKLGNLQQAVEDCTAAINLDETYVKAYLRRAKCYQDLEQHEEAVRDYEKTFKLDRNQEHKRLLQESKIILKKSKWKDYYKILGVTKQATEDEIKKSYRKMALQHHPDRHASASEKDKLEHEVKFKEIGEAYTVLTDSKKKAMYDRGQDFNDPEGGFGCDSEVDPNQIFQAFFNQGGSNFNYGGGGGGFQSQGFSGAGFPSGFHFQFG